MLRRNGLFALALASCGSCVAQDLPQWEVVFASRAANVAVPGAPPASAYVALGVGLASEGSGAFRAELSFPDGMGGYPMSLWHSRGAGLEPFAEPDVAGPTGPNRSGAESHHVFDYIQGLPDSVAGNTWVFSGSAGEPGETGTLGVWIHAGSSNQEIARAGTDGPLGPGLGAGWVFHDFSPLSDPEPELRALPDGGALLRSHVLGLGSETLLDAVNRYTPGVGVHTCALEGSSDPALAPGIVGAGLFRSIYDRINVAATGEIIGSARTTLGGRGLWTFCQSAPSPRAYTDTSGLLGPGSMGAEAQFTSIAERVAPAAPGTFYFSAEGRLASAPGSDTFSGVFLSTENGNVPMLLSGTEGPLGPKLPGHVFVRAEAVTAGSHAIALATIQQGDIQRSGFWRLTRDAGPQPLAIEGDTGDYAPGAGHVWSDFLYWSLRDNGDLIVFANTDNDTSLWRLRLGMPPQQILQRGDLIAVPTTEGIVHAPLTGFGLVYELGAPWPGADFWSSTRGSVLIGAEIEGFSGNGNARTWIRGVVSFPDRLLADGFDG